MGIKNLKNKTFGRLKVIEMTDKRRHGSVVWKCLCECGNIIEVTTNCLTRWKTKSCGCYCIATRKENCAKTFTTHGQSKSKLYHVWQGIKRRCYSLNSKAYKDYGGRGIIVCDSWKTNFQNFQTWAMNNGYKEGLTIERINVNGNYEPNNCTWIPLKKQNMNRRTTHYLTYNGETLSITEWARITGIPRKTISQRINNYHWTVEKALTTKVKKQIYGI